MSGEAIDVGCLKSDGGRLLKLERGLGYSDGGWVAS